MNTVTIGISTVEQLRQRADLAFKGQPQGAFLTFETLELMWKTLTPRRWEILRAMTGENALSLRAIARLVGRDVKTTHQDVHALLDVGILTKTGENRIVFPYDAVHVDFTITKAA
jgi:predicted transcriptional regulator